jgi:hypothetical protein
MPGSQVSSIRKDPSGTSHRYDSTYPRIIRGNPIICTRADGFLLETFLIGGRPLTYRNFFDANRDATLSWGHVQLNLYGVAIEIGR